MADNNIIIGLDVQAGRAIAEIDKAAAAIRGVDKAERDLTQTDKALKSIEQQLINQNVLLLGTFEKLSNGVGKTNSETKKAASAFDTLKDKFREVAALASTVGLGVGISSFASEIVRATAQFEKFAAILSNSLGSEIAGRQAQDQLAQFAATTNFSLEEVTASFIRLNSLGFQPTQDQLLNLADLSNAFGQNIQELVDSTAAAFRGEFDPLEKFGVQIKAAGDNLELSFKGVQTVIPRTKEAILDYVLSLGELEGVQGTTTAISKTLGGQLSNLGDQFTATAASIGNDLKPALTTIISGLGTLLQSLATLVGFVAKNITGFSLLASVILAVKYQAVIANVLSLARAKELLNVGIGKVTGGFKALGAAIKANPIGAAAAAITALVAVYDILRDKVSAAEKQQKAFSASIDDVNVQVEAERSKLNGLFDQLTKTNAGTAERKALVDQVNQQYGQYLPNLLTESASLDDIAKARDLANKALEREIKLKGFEELLIDLTKQRAKAQLELNKALGATADATLAALPLGLGDAFKALDSATGGAATSLVEWSSGAEASRELAAELDKEIAFLTGEVTKLTTDTAKNTTATGANAKAQKEAEKAYNDLTKAVEKFRVEQAKALQQAELGAIENPFAKQLAASFADIDEVVAEGVALTNAALAQGRTELVGTIQAGTADALTALIVDSRAFLAESLPELTPGLVAGFDNLLDKVAKGADANAVKAGISDLFADATLEALSGVFGIAFLPTFGPLFLGAGEKAADEFAKGINRRAEQQARIDLKVGITDKDALAEFERLRTEVSKRAEDQRKQADQRELDDQRRKQEALLGGIADFVGQSIGLLQTLNQAEINRADIAIEQQKRRVEAAEALSATAGAAQLAEERKRLNEIQRQREQFVRRQVQLDLIERVSSASVAIARAIAGAAGAGPFAGVLASIQVAAILVALTAGIAQAKAAAESATPQFEAGGYVHGPRHKQGGRKIEVEGGEYVFNRRATALFGEKVLDKMNSGLIPRELLGAAPAPAIVNMRLDTLERRLDSIKTAVENLPIQQVNITERGLHATVVRASQARHVAKQATGL
jgi:hypothetical protein